MAPKPMNFNDGPLVWIDCEMTGLDPQKDKILEIAVRFEYVAFVLVIRSHLKARC
jgi:oligoribonuclease (3'-5' exoribonuclease)